MLDLLFKSMGALGLLLIVVGIITKRRHKNDWLYFAGNARREQDLWYLFGGILLEIYSIYIGDLVFIFLQLVFICAAAYDYLTNRAEKLHHHARKLAKRMAQRQH